MRLATLKIWQLIRPANPHRTSWDEEAMNELVESIKQIGLVQPIVVEPVEGGYQVKAGDRRLEAHRRAGIADVQCLIRDPSDMMQGEAVTWAENLAREDLAPMDQARQVERMHTTAGLSRETIARLTNRSVQWVDTRLTLTRMPDDLRSALTAKSISIAAALALARVTDNTHRSYLLAYSVNSGAAVPIIKEWVAEWEATVARGDGSIATLPPMPLDGQPYIVSVPCWLCHEPHDHNTMIIQRVCRPCAQRMNETLREIDAQPEQPTQQEEHHDTATETA